MVTEFELCILIVATVISGAFVLWDGYQDNKRRAMHRATEGENNG